jgi:hypothetical protein
MDIPCIFHVYVGHLHIHGIYHVYAWYIPKIGVPDARELPVPLANPLFIWNPDHLDKNWQNGTYVSEHGTDMYVHVQTVS